MGGVSGAGGPSGTGYMARASKPQGPAHVYQPTYGNYTSPMNQAVYGVARGLGATPQYTQFQAQMPTYSRPQMAPPPPSGGFGRFPMQSLSPQPAYRIPYGPSIPQRPRFGLFKGIGGSKQSPEQQAQNLARDIQRGELTYAMYESMMADPNRYLPFVQDVQAGNTPTSIGYRPTPIQYMTAAQRDAYNAKQSQALSELLGPAPVDPSTVDSGGGA